MSTAHDLPLAFGEPAAPALPPALRLVPAVPLDFDDAVRRLRPRLHRYAIRRLGDAHEAEELVQEALLRAYSHRAQLHTEDDLSAWTTVVTGRLVIDRLRVRGRSTSVAEVPETGRMGRDTADVVVARDEARTALDALDAMPPRQAALLWAREVEGHSYEELCTRFGMTEPAVRSVLTRARKALREQYAKRGGTLPVGGLAVLAPWVGGMHWADRLRTAVSRITGPAALATVGVTALGGLVLAPFGGGFAPGQSTFAPSTAILSQTTASVTPEPAALHGFVLAAATTRLAPTAPAAEGTPQAGQPHGVIANHVGVLVESTPCSEGSSSYVPPSLPAGIGLGGTHCGDPSTRLSVPLPAGDLTGYGDVNVSSTDIQCSQVSPLTSTGLVQCTQEKSS